MTTKKIFRRKDKLMDEQADETHSTEEAIDPEYLETPDWYWQIEEDWMNGLEP